MSDALFDIPETRVQIDTLSPDRQRTIRNRLLLERGVHPVSRRKLLGGIQVYTCGDCIHHKKKGRYHKCDLNSTSGAATDIRVSWPACELFSMENKS
jgi:hypothetical protein